ncbi:MAG: hypothetical protein J0H09_08310 [Burkholderiales bacterium]|nr:hypothetical protein [Burkholderiales bacterium]
MGTRGRRSASAQEVAIVAPVAHARLPAPTHISDAERAVWLQVVNDQPATAFSATHAPLLELYCRHVVNARVIAEELLAFERSWLADEDGLKRYDRLLAMSEREGRAASSLATRLRITRQAVDHPETVARELRNQPAKQRKPWELPAS